MNKKLEFDNTEESVIYTVVPMGYEMFGEIEATVFQKLCKKDPTYDQCTELITQILDVNKKLVGVLERGEIIPLTTEDVEDLVSIINLHMNCDNLMRRAIYHEGVLNGMRMMKENI